MLLGSLLLIAVAKRGTRAEACTRLLLPLGVMSGSLAALAVVGAGIAFYPELQRAADETAQVWPSLLVAYAMLCVVVGLIVALWTGVPLVVQHFFRAVDGHPTLRALVALAVAAWSVTLGVISTVRDGLDGDYPAVVGLGLLMGGSVCLSGIAVAELVRLQRRWQITVRAVVVRAATPSSTATSLHAPQE